MATPEELKRQKEITRLKKLELEYDKQSSQISRADVANSDDFSSLLRENLKSLKLVQAAKSEILSIDRRITKQVNDAFAFDIKQLGNAKASQDLAKQRVQLERDRVVLMQKSGAELTTDKKLQAQINATIKQRVKTAEELLKVNQKNQDISKEIQGNLSVRSFSGLAGIADKVGLGDFVGELNDAAQAAREAVADNIEGRELTKNFGLENADLGALSDEEKNIISKATAGEAGDKGFGKGLTKDLMEKAGLGNMGQGVGAAAKIKGAGGLEGIEKATKKLNPLIKGLKALGPALKKLLGPLAILAEIIALDKQTADMAKNMNMTYKEAQKLRAEMQSIANSSGENFVTGKKLVESFVELNKELGTSGTKLVGELLTSMTQLREMAGFTNEEMMGLAKLALTTDDNMEDITGEFMAAAKAAGVQNGVMVNTKTLSKDISNLSAATTLSLGKNPKLLGEALAVTKALGMEMEQLEGIASGLMNFEESIKNELEAELLLGKNINLEKARQAALNNDLATLAQEIAEQAGTSAEFAEMNRIQQEALAKSVGMSREELANTLFVQEQLAGSTGEEAEEQERLLNARIAEVGLAQAQKEMADQGFEGLKKQVGMADRLTATMDKLNEVFVSLIEPLMPILDVFVMLFGLLGKIVALVKPLLDAASFVGNLIGDSIGSVVGGVGSMLEGGSFSEGVDFSATKASGQRLQDDNWMGKGLQMAGVPTAFAKGGIVTGPTNAIIGEAGPEAVIPLNKEINVDNSKMEAILSNIDKNLSKQKPMTPFMVSVG